MYEFIICFYKKAYMTMGIDILTFKFFEKNAMH